MKKSIILLITMLFITAIILLIMDNLKDSDKFFNTSSSGANFVQMNVSIKNINNELIKQLNKVSKEDLEDAFKKIKLLTTMPIEIIKIKNIDSKMITQDNYYDINKDYTNTDDSYLIENIDYRYDLFKLVKDKNITNSRQLTSIINDYINITKDDKILKLIKDDKFLINYKQYDDINNTKLFISCNYDLQINNLKSHIDMIFEHKKNDIKYFDFYILGKNVE